MRKSEKEEVLPSKLISKSFCPISDIALDLLHCCCFLISAFLFWSFSRVQELKHFFRELTYCHTEQMESGLGLEFDREQLLYVDPSDLQPHQRMAEFAADWRLNRSLPSQGSMSIGTCIYNIPGCAVGEKYPTETIVPQSTLLYTKQEVELGVENTLICLVSAFQPPPLNISWRRNGATVREKDVINTQYYSDGDFNFRLYSYLSFLPEQGDVYSCTVQHRGLQQDSTRFYEVDVQDSQTIETFVLVLGIILGFLGFFTGIIFIVKSFIVHLTKC